MKPRFPNPAGDEVFVEYGPGPEAFMGRWNSRPPTPDFDWEMGQEIVPPHDLWLRNLSLSAEDMDHLVPDAVDLQSVMTEDELVAYDKTIELAKARSSWCRPFPYPCPTPPRLALQVKEKLITYSGVLHAVCIYYQVLQKPISKDNQVGDLDLNGFR